ncbi:MAG TPA: hypothetical protein VFE50_22750, partial [Cyclobacteriaceae bacterium]|nr:hypothetical protein [Cyclobacteriaceae bacterium]
MQPLKITRNEIPLLVKGICLGVLLVVPVLLVFVFNVVHRQMFLFFAICIFISVCVWTFKVFIIINFQANKISEGYQVLGFQL